MRIFCQLCQAANESAVPFEDPNLPDLGFVLPVLCDRHVTELRALLETAKRHLEEPSLADKLREIAEKPIPRK